jgi:hypothetical protein
MEPLPAGADAGGPPERGGSAEPPRARQSRAVKILIPLAVILIAALIQIATSLPSGTESAQPYSADTCTQLFGNPAEGEMRVACERGLEIRPR